MLNYSNTSKTIFLLGFLFLNSPAEAKVTWLDVKMFFIDLLPNPSTFKGCLGYFDEDMGSISISISATVTYTMPLNLRKIEEELGL